MSVVSRLGRISSRAWSILVTGWCFVIALVYASPFLAVFAVMICAGTLVMLVSAIVAGLLYAANGLYALVRFPRARVWSLDQRLVHQAESVIESAGILLAPLSHAISRWADRIEVRLGRVAQRFDRFAPVRAL